MISAFGVVHKADYRLPYYADSDDPLARRAAPHDYTPKRVGPDTTQGGRMMARFDTPAVMKWTKSSAFPGARGKSKVAGKLLKLVRR